MSHVAICPCCHPDDIRCSHCGKERRERETAVVFESAEECAALMRFMAYTYDLNSIASTKFLNGELVEKCLVEFRERRGK